MIVEHRTCTFRPGTVNGWLEKYETEGLPIQKRHLGRFVGLYVSEIGRLHRIVLIWAYESLADREKRQAAMGRATASTTSGSAEPVKIRESHKWDVHPGTPRAVGRCRPRTVPDS